MVRTYNQIIFYLEEFTKAHKQLGSIGNGFKTDLNSYLNNNDEAFYLYVEPLNIELAQSTQNNRFRIYCLGVKQKDANNSRDLLSDTAQILEDARKFLIYQFEQTQIWALEGASSTLTPVNNYTADFTVGWYMDIVISSSIVQGDCDVPYFKLELPDFNPEPGGIDCDSIAECPIISEIQESIDNIQIEQIIQNTNITNVTQNVSNITNEVTNINNEITNINNTVINIEGDLSDINNELVELIRNALTCDTLEDCEVFDELQSLATQTSSDLAALTSVVNSLSTPIFKDDFFHQINGNGEWFWRGRTSTNTVNQASLPSSGWGTNIDAVNGRVGIWRIFLSSSATRVSGIYRQNNGISNSFGNGHKLTFETLFVSASGNERGVFSCGYLNDTSAASDSNASVTFDNSAYIRYDYFGDNFQLVTSNAGTATVTNITNLVVVGDWSKVKIELTPTECRFIINDVLVGTHTTDIPQLTGVGFSVNRMQGASPIQGIWLDKVKLERI